MAYWIMLLLMSRLQLLDYTIIEEILMNEDGEPGSITTTIMLENSYVSLTPFSL